MKLFAIAPILLLALCPTPANAASCGAQERVLRQAKLEAWPGYYRRQDVAGLRNFLADGFRLVAADGQVTTKAMELDWLARNPWRPQEFSYDIQSVECPTPSTAVVIGVGRVLRTGEHGARTAHLYTSSNYFVRIGARWRAVASHISGERTETDASPRR